MNKRKLRSFNLDLIRSLAILAVIMIHVTRLFVSQCEVGTIQFTYPTVLNCLSRVAVPFFLMISGALLLNEEKEYEVADFFSKVKKLIIILFSWSAIYDIIMNVIKRLIYGLELETEIIISEFFFGHFHLWYLYMIIGMYLITPFLRKFAKKENADLVLLFIILSAASSLVIPAIRTLSIHFQGATQVVVFLQKFNLDFFGGYTAYFLSGWYIKNVGIKERKHRIIIYFASLISVIALTVYVALTGNYSSVLIDKNVFIFVYSFGAFLFFNCVRPRLTKPLKFIVANLSRQSFGMYLIHLLFFYLFKDIYPYEGGSVVLYILYIFGTTAVVSYFVSLGFSKIPGIRKIIML